LLWSSSRNLPEAEPSRYLAGALEPLGTEVADVLVEPGVLSSQKQQLQPALFCACKDT
jgi:hypothetical protein